MGDHALTPHLARKRSRRGRSKYQWVDPDVESDDSGKGCWRTREQPQPYHEQEEWEAMGKRAVQPAIKVERCPMVLMSNMVEDMETSSGTKEHSGDWDHKPEVEDMEPDDDDQTMTPRITLVEDMDIGSQMSQPMFNVMEGEELESEGSQPRSQVVEDMDYEGQLSQTSMIGASYVREQEPPPRKDGGRQIGGSNPVKPGRRK